MSREWTQGIDRKVYVKQHLDGSGWGVYRELDRRAFREAETLERAVMVGQLYGKRVIVLNESGKVTREFSGI